MEVNNIYKYFRGTKNLLENELLFSKKFDEPTYLSFRLMFDSEDKYNYTGFNVSNDQMPHPLFNYNDNTKSTEDIEHYSAIRYLIDANEPGRAKMLFDFINGWKELQNYHFYYFQAIEGIGDLLKIDPTKGQRILNDKRLIITCLEGLDQRITYLINLYKKVVWDDVYQRWILPDMMRYFNLNIYLTEFRTFHAGFSKIMSVPSGPGTTDTIIKPTKLGPITTNFPSVPKEGKFLNLSILDGILPIWQIKCEMCEFDINSIEYEHLNNLNIGNEPMQGTLKFQIKVGNIKDIQSYPLFNYIMNDKKLGGIGRLQDPTEQNNVITSSGYGTAGGVGGEDITVPNNIEIFITQMETRIAQGSGVVDTDHISGLPYNEDKNDITVINTDGDVYKSKQPKDFSKATNTQGKGEINETTVFYDDKSGQLTEPPIDSTLPNTWVGNALDFGTSYAINFAKKWIDKGKITSIPGLGISFTEIMSAIQSKDIVTAFGMIRKGINEVSNEFVYPSMLLTGNLQSGSIPEKTIPSQILGIKIVDNIMAQLILELSKSDATDKQSLELINAANLVLNDKGLWEQIKDYSLATNLVGPKEYNIQNEITEKEGYKSIQDEETNRLSNIVESGMKQNVKASTSLDDVAESGLKQNIKASSNLNGEINANMKTTNEKSEATNMNDWETVKAMTNYGISQATKNKLVGETTIQTTIISKRNVVIGEVIEAPPSSLTTKSVLLPDKTLQGTELFKANEGNLSTDHFESNSQVKTEINVQRLSTIEPFKANMSEIEESGFAKPEVSQVTNSKIDIKDNKDTQVSKATNNTLQ